MKGTRKVDVVEVNTKKHMVYTLDTAGNIAEVRYYYNNINCGKGVYIYENGRLVNHKSYRSYTYKRNPDYSGFRWDSTVLTMEENYDYENGRIRTYRIYMDDRHIISKQIDYSYSNDGSLKKEEITEYPTPTQSDELDDNPVDTTLKPEPVHRRRVFEYDKNTTEIQWYNKDKLAATEKVLSLGNNIVSRTILNAHKKKVKQFDYSYTAAGLCSDVKIVDSGLDGFGDDDSPVLKDKETYEYDTENRLVSKKSFLKDKVVTESRYIYSR